MDTRFKSVHVYPTDDPSLPTFDNTKLVAINTCPTWGIVRYTKHKTMASGTGRSMALEAGGAAHQVFAAHRLFAVREAGFAEYRVVKDVFDYFLQANGERLFGRQRYKEMLEAIDPREDIRQQRLQFALTALYNSGFYDDPSDKRRTMTNIEEMCIAYMDKYNWSSQLPILTMLNDVPMFGIEIPVDVTLAFDTFDGETKRYRFIGKADAIHYKDESQTVARIHENKTASRLGSAWEESWETNHQPTGYMIALSTMLHQQINEALILGSALPLPKSYTINGLSRVPVTRYDFQFAEWLEWFWHTVQLHDTYADRPLDAPQYTHSCNRYFRPCSFIILCASEPDERSQIYDEMRTDKWSPLDEDDEGSAD